MKTYIALIKQKTHWLHLTSAVLVLSFFTSVSLLQYAGQQFASATINTSLISSVHPNRHVLGTKIKLAKPGSQAPPVIGTSSAATPKTYSAQTVAAPPAAPASTPSPPATPATPPPSTPGNDIASEAICPGQSYLSSVARVLACMTAYARTQHGLQIVSKNTALNAAASAKAADMLACGYSHTACGREFNYWFAAKGFAGRCTAENIAMGQLAPGQVFHDWMNSAGHRANILNPAYNAIGAAVIASSGGNLWAMELGGC